MKNKIYFIRYLTILLFLFTQVTAIAVKTPLYFSNLRYENGLPSNVTNSIVQDKAGFIWIGTDEGLCRYDGYSMMHFTQGNTPNAIPSNRISALLVDNDLIWVATWDGLCTINTKTFEVNLIPTGDIKVFRSLYKDRDGKIWIGSAEGILIYNAKKNEYKYYCSGNSTLSNNTIRYFFQDSKGIMWIGTFDKLNRFDGKQFSSYDLKGDYKPNIHNNLILSIAPHPKDASLLWVGTETGLCLFNKKYGSYSVINTQNSSLSNEVIKCIYVDGDKLWLGTDYGLNTYDYRQNITSYYHNPNINYTISNNVVISIFKDSSNLLWFVTPNGVSILNNRTNSYQLHELFYSANDIKAGNQVRDILALPDGTIWAATIHGVVKQQANNKQSFTMSGKPNQRLILNNCSAIEIDECKRIWIGTAGGINIWDEEKQRMHTITASEKNGLQSNYIKQVKATKDGNIWISSWDGGIFKAYGDIKHPEELQFLQISEDGEALITTLNNSIYFTSKDALWRFAPQTSSNQKLIHLPYNYDINNVTCITNDGKNNIWMGRKDGLWKYDVKTDSLTNYPFQTKNQSTLLSIEADTLGFIWLSTHNAVLNYTNEGRFIRSIPLNTNTPIKSFVTQCSTIGNGGAIYFGGENGYIEIKSDSIIPDFSLKKTIISRLEINNLPINPINQPDILHNDIAYTSSINLEYINNSITLEFSNLSYWLSERHNYKYKLIGFDKDWNYTNSNKAIYSNLTPGQYQFLLSEDQPTDNTNPSVTKLNIRIKPPIWLSNIVLFLYALILGAIVYAIFHIIKYRYKLKNQLHIAQIEKEHSEQILKVRQQFFTNISHEFRTPLSLIVPPIKQVLNNGKVDDNSKRLLQLAERNSKRLMSLVNQILDFSKLEKSTITLQKTSVDIIEICKSTYETFTDLATRNEIDYTIKFNTSSLIMEVDSPKIETILFNLLSNAFKFTPVNGKISLGVVVDEKYLSITILDSGSGISKKEQKQIFERYYQSRNNTKLGSGIGLAISKDYALLHKGSLSVSSTQEKGSLFTLRLPLGEKNSIIHNTLNYTTLSNDTKIVDKVNIETNSELKTLLVIDDNPDILEFINLNLNEKYNLINATNGTEGFEMANRHQPQLIISDVMMPGIDGFELCKKLKSNKKTSYIPIILLTAKGMNSQKIEGMDSGADMYITKPFETEYLISCVESIFRREQFTMQYTKNLLITNPNNPTQETNNQDEIFLKKVMDIIESNLQNSAFSVETLSQEIGISTTHLYRKLKTLTGHSTQDIIKNYRLKKASQMIINNEGNISEIMYRVGFSNLSTFSKRFKAEFGVSPSEYAKENQ